MSKYLIVGLGNIGKEYEHTRHNIGFDVADALCKELNGTFDLGRLAVYAKASFKGKQLHIIKPTTYMNLSGKAIKYWMNELKIPRLKFGIGNDFPKGKQVEFVLGKWNLHQEIELQERIAVGVEIVKAFCVTGLANTMNLFNNK